MMDFMKNAWGLTKNPLGIIGMFISLIYGIAAIVLTRSETLESAQRWPIVWFVVFFPLVILVAFLVLVIWHHTKLYGPGDYKDEGNFVKISAELQKRKAEREVAEAINSETSTEIPTEYKEIGNLTSPSPNTNKVQSPDPILEKNIKMKYYMAEDLVIRQLEQELNVTIQRHMAFKSDESLTELDGIAHLGSQTVGIEIKYVKTDFLSRNTISSLLNTAKKLENLKNKRFKLIIVLVYEELPIINLETLKSYLFGLKIVVDIKQFNLKELQNKFGL